MDQNGVIGREGSLPWHLPADLRWFRRQTLGKPVIMGRLTYDSIGRALPRRCNIVLTRSADFAPPGCSVADSAQAALDVARAVLQPDGPCASADPPEIMVIGGGQIYRRFLPLAQRIYLTRVEAQVAGDTWFPPIAWEEWQVVWEERFSADDRHAWPFTCLILERQPLP
jgi:dihydrofolate reductase